MGGVFVETTLRAGAGSIGALVIDWPTDRIDDAGRGVSLWSEFQVQGAKPGQEPAASTK